MIDEADKAALREYFDLRYKKLDDCDREMKAAENEHHNLDKRLSIIETQQKFNNWLTALIAGGIITLVIKAFVGG